MALYAVGLLTSDAGTWFKHRKNPAYQTLGASGAILAVLFASIIYFPTASLFILPIPIPIPAPLFAVSYVAYSYYASRRAIGYLDEGGDRDAVALRRSSPTLRPAAGPS